MNKIDIEYEILQETSDIFRITLNGEHVRFVGWIQTTTFFDAIFYAIGFACEQRLIKESQE